MQKLSYLLLIAAISTFMSACTATKVPTTPTVVNVDTLITLHNEADSLSYALGVLIQASLDQQGLDTILDYDVMNKAMRESRKDTAQMKTIEANVVMSAYQDKIAQAKNAALTAEGTAFLAANAKKEGVKTTASGLQYKVLKAGNGAKPTATSKVTVHYEGKLLNGTIFDSSYKRGETISFGLNQVIPGWTEGLQLMNIGSKYEFYIPYNLAYGERGAGKNIPPYSTLVFVVELFGIE